MLLGLPVAFGVSTVSPERGVGSTVFAAALVLVEEGMEVLGMELERDFSAGAEVSERWGLMCSEINGFSEVTLKGVEVEVEVEGADGLEESGAMCVSASVRDTESAVGETLEVEVEVDSRGLAARPGGERVVLSVGVKVEVEVVPSVVEERVFCVLVESEGVLVSGLID